MPAVSEWFRIHRKRLDVRVALQDAERGRPLTDAERLDNLLSALIEDEEDEAAALRARKAMEEGE